MQVRNHLPKMPRQIACDIGEAGPSPDTLEKTKQRALYSDCLEKKGKLETHVPSVVDWEGIAHYVLSDARVVVMPLRHYSAAELRYLAKKHAKLCQKEGRGFEYGTYLA